MSTNRAILIIDMQKGSFTPKTPRYDSEGVVKRINQLSLYFRENNQSVIIIQHDGSQNNEFIPNTEEWEVLDSLTLNPDDIYINKFINDAFYNSKLDETLKDLNITELYFTGCATDFCIESTIQSAIAKDYSVTIVSDAHTTADRPQLKAKQVIDHYNWVWQNMIPNQNEVKVLTTNEIIR